MRRHRRRRQHQQRQRALIFIGLISGEHMRVLLLLLMLLHIERHCCGLGGRRDIKNEHRIAERISVKIVVACGAARAIRAVGGAWRRRVWRRGRGERRARQRATLVVLASECRRHHRRWRRDRRRRRRLCVGPSCRLDVACLVWLVWLVHMIKVAVLIIVVVIVACIRFKIGGDGNARILVAGRIEILMLMKRRKISTIIIIIDSGSGDVGGGGGESWHRHRRHVECRRFK